MQSNRQAVRVNGCYNQLLNGWNSWITKAHLFGQGIISAFRTLKEAIFANFTNLGDFAKVLAKTYSRKLILAKNTKQPNFQTFFKLMIKKKIQKHSFVCIKCLFCLKIYQNLK